MAAAVVEKERTKADLSGREKAAILLIAMGPEKSAKIFKHLKEEEIERDRVTHFRDCQYIYCKARA